ncbi:hypothetical protein CNEO4_1300007 [Clostridium neonatale]|nr:hypothetical protein CNEO4_1300007 [Clostridium neonatale]CAI3589522.1 hypothetical protein CNEO4_1380006 [Clostridium neonatale]CAI3665985.1 hypothetical protein CNEO3_570025 [Clostridium neonatale]CAI3675696.1 hypothetical protein CNEO4_500024 [Clostridium neonatale]CAI3679051.1 hypothetical protein CNEO4_660025 [Clostridium neonatale]
MICMIMYILMDKLNMDSWGYYTYLIICTNVLNKCCYVYNLIIINDM